MAERFLAPSEVARILSVSKMTIYRLIHGDELAAVRVGRSFRIPESALQRYILQGGNDLDSPAMQASANPRSKA